MPKYPTTKLKTIKYDSPSGKIKINKWVPPFKKVKDGFGFVGVLAEDAGTGLLQCHVCGQWYELLSAHITAKHNMDTEEYDEEYGLLRSTALRSMRMRKIHSENMLGMRKKHKKHRGGFKKGNKESANRKGTTRAVESQNRYGVCELQIIDKIKRLQKKLGKTPALTEVIDAYGGGFASIIHSRYGGYLPLLKSLKITPVTSSFTPKFSKKYFIRKGIKALVAGKKLIGGKILNQSEARHIYDYFSSQGTWKTAVSRALINSL